MNPTTDRTNISKTGLNNIAVRYLGAAIAAIALLAVCMVGLAGCSGSSSSQAAATVNGKTISEQTVTDYIEKQRAALGYTDEESWAEYLSQSGYTPEEIRSQVVEGMIQEELMRQGAEGLGATVDQSQVDEYIESAKSGYGSDEEWQQALDSAGYTEEELRESYEMNLLQQAVMDALQSDVADEEKLEMASMYSQQYDGAKRSSHILVEDEATAQDILNRLNSGSVEFAAAAEENSIDTGSAANGGDVGWDKLTTFVAEYQEALDGLEVGQISGIVKSDYGYHIIMATDLFNVPEEITSLDQIPEDILSYIENMMNQQNSYTAFSEWLQKLQDEGEIVINDMPSGLPYYLDPSKYQTAEADSGADAADVNGDADTGENADAGSEE